ncbi:DMT family transporter [Streptomyces bambusae]|uniref:EamA family transporter n=1 Tax=Streptomyces bambusae TaxID=1550616 RepID=UPI001CFDE43A|nr:DMT family transporter [Streptomyces bambusae]MCB5165018.1 DMT family transporter [Streptomyces bambusae]
MHTPPSPTSAYGLSCVAVAVVLQAIGNGVFDGRISSTDSFLISFLAFFSAAVIFNVVQAVRRRADPGTHVPLGRRGRSLLVQLNVATAVTFLGFYLALSLMPSGAASFLEAGVVPLVIFVLLALPRGARPAWRDLPVAVLVFGLACVSAWRFYQDSSPGHAGDLLTGAILALVAGAGAGCIGLISRRLGEARVAPVTVSAHRFHLTYLIALGVLVFRADQLGSPAHIGQLWLISLLTVTIPLFVLQIGLQRSDTFRAGMVMSCLPAGTYLSAVALGGEFDVPTMALMAAAIAVPALFTVFTRRRAPLPDSSAKAPSPA